MCGRRVRRRAARIAKRIKHVFYRCDSVVAWHPTLSYRLDFGPTFGLRAFHKNLYGAGESMSLRIAFGGRYIQSYRLATSFPRLGKGRWYAAGSASFADMGNLIFRGIGNPPEQPGGTGLDPREGAVDTRFKKSATNLTVRGGRNLGRRGNRFQIGATTILNDLHFGSIGVNPTDRSIEQVYDVDRLPGFTDGASVLELLGEFAWDTRDRMTWLGRGVTLRVFAGGSVPINRFRYFRHGGDLTIRTRRWGRHMFSAALIHEAVLGSEEDIPFTTQPRLGGVRLLRGYAAGSLRDRLAVVAIGRYEFPVFRRSIRAALFVDAGKVASSYGQLAGARNLTDHWQQGVGAAVILESTPDIHIRLGGAYGDGLQLRFVSNLASFTHGPAYIP